MGALGTEWGLGREVVEREAVRGMQERQGGRGIVGQRRWVRESGCMTSGHPSWGSRVPGTGKKEPHEGQVPESGREARWTASGPGREEGSLREGRGGSEGEWTRRGGPLGHSASRGGRGGWRSWD